MAAAPKNAAATPLPARLTGLLREARWLALVAIAFYLFVVLLTYHYGDPGWSTSTRDVARNAGGQVGAAIADVLLSAFGLSAYW